MNTYKDIDISEFRFNKPAIYQIKVKGDISELWSHRLAGMQITIEKGLNDDNISILIGRMADQSELSGVLNSLFELHLPVISVHALSDIDNEQ